MEMNRGKLAETILKRAVLKQRIHRRQEVRQSAAAGVDASVLYMEKSEEMIVSVNPVVGKLTELADTAVYAALNNIWVQGGEAIGILTCLLLPVDTKEEELRDFTKSLEQICESLNIEIIGGHTEVAVAVNQPIVTVTGIGRRQETFGQIPKVLPPSWELVMTGWAGQEGSALLAKEKEKELRSRYTQEFIENAVETVKGISVFHAVKTARESGECAIHDITGGGIFGALWELSSAYNIGISVDLKKIPIRQETIEICEFFNLNPYVLTSRGCLLLAAEHGNELVLALTKAGVKAAVIGRITENHDKVVINEEETRFLEPPKEEELLKVL